MMDRVEALIEARKLIDEHMQPILESLKDKSIPLEERWAAYSELVKNDILTEIETYGDGFVDVLGDNITLHDDFYIELHQMSRYTTMYQSVAEAQGDCAWEEKLFSVQKNLPEWQEQVLASGRAGFINDW